MLKLDSHPQQLKAKTLPQLTEAMVILEESGRSLKRWHREAILDIPELEGCQYTHMCFQNPPLAAFTRTLRISFSATKLCAGHQELLLRSILTATGEEPLPVQPNLSRLGQEIQGAISEISDCIIEFIQLGRIPHLYIGVASFAALPYLMQVLDLKIARQSHPETQLTDQYHRLCLLTEAVKEYQGRYGGMEHFGSTIQFVITNFQLFTQHMPESVRVAGWQDVLVHNPSCYMRLALILEHCARTATIPTAQQLAGDIDGAWTIPTLQSLDTKQVDGVDHFTWL
ncbi:hypothetical protein FSARC_5541 [Fusarium sarcochroum]|uniref:Uncharacterized protein n=1 Tax=Fusarium sarcochroum TaxID=1208366 RepID=A0A8H4XAA7_9HYPO|nr:hypothetical protein FSARC_5541 [Fusarium sarcochroum]